MRNAIYEYRIHIYYVYMCVFICVRAVNPQLDNPVEVGHVNMHQIFECELHFMYFIKANRIKNQKTEKLHCVNNIYVN